MLQLPDHNLIQDCPTRWGSTLAMLKRVSEQQAAIAAVLMEGRLQHLMPEGEEWNIIENVVNIHIFKEWNIIENIVNIRISSLSGSY